MSALLLDEHDDVDTLAKAVIETLDQLRAERPFFVAAVVHDGIPWAYGPVSTAKQAEKLLTRIPLTGLTAGTVQVFPAQSLSSADEPAPGKCGGCGHPAASHNWPKSKIRGCVVGEVTRGGKIVRPACECGEFVA